MAQKKDKKQISSFRMDKDLKKRVEAMAKRENRSLNNMLEVICREAVNKSEAA
jgi:hypothetical protein